MKLFLPQPRRGVNVASAVEISSRAAHIASMSGDSQPSALTVQLLSWIASRPRNYDETMEAWRTNCPRMPVWEDAVSDGLVALNGSSAMKSRAVVLTDRGRAMLDTHKTTFNGHGDSPLGA
jgi:hypothetical protein